MNREIFIDGDKTILNTKFYLYLLNKEKLIDKAIYLIQDILNNPEKYNGKDNVNNLLSILKGENNE